MMEKLLKDLKTLVSIPSFSGEEKLVADWMEQRLQEEGFAAKRYLNNVWVTSAQFDINNPTVLLNSHLDTVKVCNGWNYPPFTCMEVGNRLYGLGINDAGASLIALFHVFLRMESQNLAYNLVFLASAEEENSGKNGLETMRDRLGTIDMAIVGEPTGGKVAIAEKGLLVIDACATGVAGHAARNTGINAITIALQDIQRIQEHHFQKTSALLGAVNVNVTAIKGGELHNVIPDECRFVIDVRLNERYSHQEILDELQTLCSAELKARSMRLSPSGLPENHPLWRAAEALKIPCFGSPTMSDQALMPWPSVKLGIGESERSHTANEFVLIEEVEQGIRIYEQYLTQLHHEIMG
jgi:acetylornithine deacetylase